MPVINALEVLMNKHCCEQMDIVSMLNCEQHNDEYECPDVLIKYIEKFDEYGLIIHDGSSSIMTIKFCPFCGFQLPASKRDLWFEKLEKLGFDDPGKQNIPNEFDNNEWYKNKSL